MPPLEKTIVAKVIAEAKRQGFRTMKNHGSSYSIKGLPDILAIRDGRCYWMEVKRPGESPTKIQHHIMRQLRSFGCQVAVVTSVAEARELLHE